MFDFNIWEFCGVLTILCSMFIIGRYLLADDLVFIPGRKRHYWKSIKHLQKASYCSICEMMLPASGQYCECCGICSDLPGCLKKADKTLKCKTMKDDKPIMHLFVKGNLPPNCTCFVCNEDVDYHAEPGLFGYRCCWCQRSTHNKCFSKAFHSIECDFGEFKDMIIPPNSLIVTQSRTKRMKINSITPPLNVKHWMPLIVIANAKSGDSNSSEYISTFRGILHPLQVAELSSKGPQDALRIALKASPNQSRILVAGGDGTIGWILNTIFEMNIQPIPLVSVLPIGTGNDLSRVLGWGSEPPSLLNPIKLLNQIKNSKIISLDRWAIDIQAVPISRIHLNLKWSPNRLVYMYNYFSIGVDAQVTLNFHKARESLIRVVSSRVINKALYLCFGTQQVVQPDCVGLEKYVDLYLDGEKIELPELQSIVCLNIDSWGAGVHLWEMSTDAEEINTHSTADGILEVLGIVSSFHIAQLQVGLNKPIRLGQARSVKMLVKQSCPVQADGEPWIQSASIINICVKDQARMLKCA